DLEIPSSPPCLLTYGPSEKSHLQFQGFRAAFPSLRDCRLSPANVRGFHRETHRCTDGYSFAASSRCFSVKQQINIHSPNVVKNNRHLKRLLISGQSCITMHERGRCYVNTDPFISHIGGQTTGDHIA